MRELAILSGMYKLRSQSFRPATTTTCRRQVLIPIARQLTLGLLEVVLTLVAHLHILAVPGLQGDQEDVEEGDTKHSEAIARYVRIPQLGTQAAKGVEET